MIKKAIAGLLGVVISSIMITSDFYTEKQMSDFNDASRSLESTNSEAKVKGSNSVGKYIENVSLEQKEIYAQPLSIKANSENYHVWKLDFNIETGKLSVVSTQTTDCTMKLEFINDDNSDDIDILKESVKVGDKIETTTMVDTSMLPQFFQVRCTLTDIHGNELSEPFISSKYMRFMQELAVSTVDDYANQYVVNLDESEDTNFFVLSDDTIVAESSEEENTLISADYDNEVYVFEHINDSIRYLSEGDFFYSQPNEMDMVAVNIKSIEIDGDTATIRGGGEIDDMFDVIKIDVDPESVDFSELENENELKNFTNVSSSDEENTNYSVEYNGTVMDDSGDYEIDYSVVSYDSINTPRALADDTSITAVEIPLEYEFKPHKTETGEAVNRYSKKDSDTNFTDNTKRSYELSAEVTVKLTLKIGIDLTFRKKKKDSDFGVDASIKAGVKVEGNAKAEWSFALDEIPPLNVLGIFFFDFEPCIKIGVKGSIKVQQEMVFTFTLHSIKKDGQRTLVHDHDFSKGMKNATNTVELEGDFYIEFVPKVWIYPFACKKLLNCSLSIPVKFNAKVSFFKAENNSNDLESGTISSALVNTKENAIHMCSLCYRIEPSVSFNVESELKIPFCEKQKIKFFKKEWKLSPWHYSSTFSEIKKGECEHYAYATDLQVIGTEDINAEGLIVEVDGKKATTNAYGTVKFFLNPKKTHTYKVYSNDKVIRSDSFSNNAEYSTFEINLNDGSTQKSDSTPITTTAPYTEPPEPHTVTSAIAAIRESAPDDLMVEGGSLGDNVFYSLYPDGLLYIFGYGPMDTSNNQIKNKSLVKNVLIEEQATFIKDEIETESTNEILIEEFTEKNQKELCAKYLENNKDDIIKVLNEEYYVEVNDPNLEEMIDDYIDVNSEEIARKYYDEHTSEFVNAISEFKKSLLADVSDKVITNIGKGLFYNCSNLESITYEGSPNEGKKAFDLPDTIISIGDSAFEGCSNLCGDIVFSDKLEKIGNYAFQNCTGITAITVPGSVKEIGIKAFMGCTNLKKAVFKEGIEDIGWGTLAGCDSLEDLTLPFAGLNLEAVENEERKIDKEGSIGTKIVHIFLDNKSKYTFKYSTELKNVTITGGTRIAPYSLYYGDDDGGWNLNYNPITNVFLSDSIKYIERNAFYHCNNLEQINLPSHLEHIGDSAFRDCVKMTLSNSELPSSLKYIGNYAFNECNNMILSNSELPSNLEYIGKNAFQNCTSLTEELIVPGSVETIEDNAFNGCTSIKKAVFKEGVGSIGKGVLKDCLSLEELTLPYAGTSFDAVENNKNTIYFLFSDTSTGNTTPNNINKLTITGGSKIPDNGLKSMSNVTEVVLPSSIKTIGNYSFNYCTGLKSIYFYDTLEYVGIGAFRDCTGIEEVGYSGSDEQWNQIIIEKDNDPILRKVNYNASAPEKTEEHIYGDTNGDGQIDMSDAVLIMQALANPNKYGINGTDSKHITAEGAKYADVDTSSIGLTLNDALRIQMYLLHRIDSLKPEN